MLKFKSCFDFDDTIPPIFFTIDSPELLAKQNGVLLYETNERGYGEECLAIQGFQARLDSADSVFKRLLASM